ncbi:MAG: nicotinamide phosphoribosyltransferase domain-containing protein [Chlamydiota bacterium]
MSISPISGNGQVVGASELQERYLAFPNISYAEFQRLPEELRMNIVSKNRILQTDTYNRFMNHIKGTDWNKKEVYVLQMRKAADGYLIVNGLQTQLEKVFGMPIAQAELDFADEFYKTANVPFFNKEMWQGVIDDHQGRLPINVHAVQDGTAILTGDPVLRVEGPGELAAHFEADFHRLFYQTLVATTAHKINELVGANRFIEVGKRSTPTEEMHLQATRAMYEGGGITLSSNDAAAACFKEIKDVGTVGHRLIQHYEDEETSFETIIQGSDKSTLLVDLVNSMSGIEKVLALKQKYRASGKVIWLRLDSGNLKDLTKYILQRFQELGFTDPKLDKVVVEDLSNPEEMKEIDIAMKDAGYDPINHVIYGAGGLLVFTKKGRSDASTGYKLSEVDGAPKMKFSDSPGKESLPGKPEIVYLDGKRIIAQENEFPNAESTFRLAVEMGKVTSSTQDSEAVRKTVKASYAALTLGTPTERSPKTNEMIGDLTKAYFD